MGLGLNSDTVLVLACKDWEVQKPQRWLFSGEPFNSQIRSADL
jgi:hypothetical protein